MSEMLSRDKKYSDLNTGYFLGGFAVLCAMAKMAAKTIPSLGSSLDIFERFCFLRIRTMLSYSTLTFPCFGGRF